MSYIKEAYRGLAPDARVRLQLWLAIVLFGILLVAFAYWFADSEKRYYTAINVVGDILQTDTSRGIMFGSSTIRKFDAAKYLQCGKWENRGIGTAGVPDFQFYMEFPFKRWKSEWILIYGGDNDVARDGHDAMQTIAIYDEFIADLFKRYVDVKIIMLEVKPSPNRTEHHEQYRLINSHLGERADSNEKLFYASPDWPTLAEAEPEGAWAFFQADGVPLNMRGNQILADAINKECKSL